MFEQALQHRPRRTAERQGGHPAQLALVRIHLNYLAAVAAHLPGKICRREHRGAGAHHQHAIAAQNRVVAAAQHLRGNRLAERNGVALDDAAAAGAVRRQILLVNGEVLGVEARVAIKAAQLVVVAVDFEQRLLPRLPMQVVHILGDEGFEAAQRLEFGQRLVAGVGLRPGQGFVQAARPFFGGVQALAPSLGGVAQKALVAVQGRLAELRPQAAGTPEGRNAAFHRNARAGERHGASRLGVQAGGLGNGGFQRRFDAELRHQWKPPRRRSSMRTARRLRRIRQRR